MSQATEKNLFAIDPEVLLSQHSWTTDQYEGMITAGILTEDDRVELLYGQIVHTSPKGNLYAYGIQELNYYLVEHFGKRFIGRQEQPIVLPNHSRPEPDYVLATHTVPTFTRMPPSKALCWEN